MAKYAERTAVPVDRSKSEIEQVLTRYGATQFVAGWDRDTATIGFKVHDRAVRFMLPLPQLKDYGTQQQWEQACRQRWRAMALAVKAKLEVVEVGIATFEEEFLAHIVIPGTGGETVGMRALPAIAEHYATGRATLLLPAPKEVQ